ncbi:pre-rRNA-processing protein TSR2 homolog isoform X2 [Lepisosteus oculatus]|uniref:pre-rRNA-processing protein TSR2 homolog isoform X2 n=1 Tax=Lepisosteus oculatus TaxID=7918 RepID=UPI0035F512FD
MCSGENGQGAGVQKMAAPVLSAHEVFAEGVRAVLETWPVLQIAVDNGFGGAHSRQKADWMVDAVQQYFHDNTDLEQDEVEDFLAELMNNEFDTVVEDGSLPQVALELRELFGKCQQGQLAEVRDRIAQLAQRRAPVKVTAVPAHSPDEEGGQERGSSEDEEEEERETEAMECEEAAGGVPTPPRAQDSLSPPDAEDGWTVVRRKKK